MSFLDTLDFRAILGFIVILAVLFVVVLVSVLLSV